MLRTQQIFFSRSAALGIFAAIGLCLLLADEGVAQNRTASYLSRLTRSDRECRECDVDRAYGAIAPPFRFYQTQWRRWPSFAPHATTSPVGQGRPFGTNGIDLPESTREDKTLPPKRDSIGDTSNDPLLGRDNGIDKPGQLFPGGVSPKPTVPDSPPTAPIDSPKLPNPFKDDKQGIDPVPGLPKDKPLPPDGGAMSVPLPLNIVSQVPQTLVIPRESFAAPVENMAQAAVLSIIRPLDDPAPRPEGVDIESARPNLLAPANRVLLAPANTVLLAPADTVPVAIAPPKLRQPKIAEPIPVQDESPRQSASEPYNPLRLWRTTGSMSAAASRLRQSNHQQVIPRETTPRRRNPLR